MERETAFSILDRGMQNLSLRNHCLSVAYVCERYARDHGQSENDYFVAGLLHDADYEQFPQQHPQVITAELTELGEHEIAQSIRCHARSFGIPAVSLMDKVLMASDELTGFVMACAKIRPDGLATLDASSVLKKFRNPKFAAGVSREEVEFALAQLGVDMSAYAAFIITALKPHGPELGLPG